MPDHEITPAIELYLASQRNLILATISRNGAPQLSPVWYIWKDGVLVISTSTSTAKWKNLSRDPRCTAIIDDPAVPRYLIASGTAKLDEGDVCDITRELCSKYKSPQELDAYLDQLYQNAHRTIIRLAPDRIATWGFD